MRRKKGLAFLLFVMMIGSIFTDTGKVTKAATEKAADGLILIQGGTFIMRSPKEERLREADETSHEVRVNSFYADPYEVTQKDYQTIMGKNPSSHKGDKKPVSNVTWYDAIRYCNKLSKKNGYQPVYKIKGKTVTWNRRADGYRLLTEAEWEYAARAGKDSIFYTGKQLTSDQSNYYGDYPYLIEENYWETKDPSVVPGEYRDTTMNVNSFEANAFGMYNMHGNVSEWCFDYYSSYGKGKKNNPAGPKEGTLRINRGGGFNDYAKHCRLAYRSVADPDSADRNLGFRIARNDTKIQKTITTKKSFTIKTKKNPKVLIAYFSDTGNTRKAAKLLQEKTGADMVEIEMKKPYSDEYKESQIDLYKEAKPALSTKVDNMEQYDVILLGYPNWWATMPRPVVSFIEDYNMERKIILPFVSHGSGIFGESVSDLSKLVQKAYVGNGFEFEYGGGSKLSANLSNWLNKNNIKENKN